jgi:hypothetical protein
MNENFDALQSSLMGLGFGVDPHLLRRLEYAMELDQPEFAVYAETCFDESTRMVAKLYIRKSEQDHHHRLIKFDARLYYSAEPIHNRTHTFLGDSITFKESFNLLEGRAVYKTFQSPWTGTYSAWIQLNFDQKDANGAHKLRQFGVKYGYDLEKVLSNYPIAELDDAAKKGALLASLKGGNVAPVTFVKATKTERWGIAALPQFKAILIYTGSKRHPHDGVDSTSNGKVET